MPAFSFGDRELGSCQRLVYASRIATASDASGGHRVRRTGEGVDFLDYRRYSVGDDVRRIDWTVFARFRQPFIRVMQHETVLHVNLLVDVSRSMDVGAPRSNADVGPSTRAKKGSAREQRYADRKHTESRHTDLNRKDGLQASDASRAGEPRTKAALACQIAAALSYVALSNGDRVTATTYSDALGPIVNDLRGQQTLPRVVQLLRDAPIGGRTDLAAAARAFSERVRHRGLAVILSDFLDPTGYQEPLRRLLSLNFRVLAVQVLDRLDWGEGLAGTLRLRDSENRRFTDLHVTERTLDEYRRRLREHAERLDAYCTRLGQYYLYADAHDPFAKIVARGLRERGLLR